MIEPQHLIDCLQACGYDTAIAVPCSTIAQLLDTFRRDNRFRFLTATSEAEAVGLAAGAYLGGRLPVLLMQNSGFCESLNAISSLLSPFEIPLPFLVTGRGSFGYKDEPQHALIGEIFEDVARIFRMEFLVLGSQTNVEEQITSFSRCVFASKHGGVLALPPGILENCATNNVEFSRKNNYTLNVSQPVRQMSTTPSARLPAIKKLREVSESTIFVATTGYTGRELLSVGDRDTNFYLVGSMGCASALACGISLFQSAPVCVLDGDGAILMKMGNCATIGTSAVKCFTHVVLNNGVHLSTGGQSTLARSIDLPHFAAAMGYKYVLQTTDTDLVAKTLYQVNSTELPSPAFIDLWVNDELAGNLPRPTVTPAAQVARLRTRLQAGGKS